MFPFKKYVMLPAEKVKIPGQEPLMLHRIQAARNIGSTVRKGDLGGYVSGKNSLSHSGLCWIEKDAVVDSRGLSKKQISVNGGTQVKGKSYVWNSILDDLADSAWPTKMHTPVVSGNATVINSEIKGCFSVENDATVKNVTAAVQVAYARIMDMATVTDSVIKYSGITGAPVIISGNAIVGGTTCNSGVYISDNARVSRSYLGRYGEVTIKDNAVVEGYQIQPCNLAKVIIAGDATVTNPLVSYNEIDPEQDWDIYISDKANVVSSNISGRAIISENANVLQSTIEDINTISGEAKVNRAYLKGENNLSGTAVIAEGFYAESLVMSSGVASYVASYEVENAISALKESSSEHIQVQIENLTDQEIGVLLASAFPQLGGADETAPSPYLTSINDTLKDYEAYSNDIVKLLKYPAMADSSVPETRNLMVVVRKVRRALNGGPPSEEALKEMSEELDNAFIVAENKALTLSVSHLKDEQKAALEKAGKMFAIACDEGAALTEKKNGFKQGIRAMEGIIPVSDEAIDLFKAKAGFLAIEA